MIPEAHLDQTDAGLVPAGPGWFVVNAREARWVDRPGRGHSLPFTGFHDSEAGQLFPQLGVAILVLGPGEPIGMYHWEADQEDFLVLAGEPVLIVEGEERPLRRWDFVHCRPVRRPGRGVARARRRGLQRWRLHGRRGGPAPRRWSTRGDERSRPGLCARARLAADAVRRLAARVNPGAVQSGRPE